MQVGVQTSQITCLDFQSNILLSHTHPIETLHMSQHEQSLFGIQIPDELSRV